MEYSISCFDYGANFAVSSDFWCVVLFSTMASMEALRSYHQWCFSDCFGVCCLRIPFMCTVYQTILNHLEQFVFRHALYNCEQPVTQWEI